MATLHKILCKICKKSVFRSRGRINENRKFGHNTYCSIVCQAQNRTRKRVMICDNLKCGKAFVKFRKEVRMYNYCSRSCAATVNNIKYPKREPMIIRVCGNNPCQERFRGNTKYCSRECVSIGRRGYTTDALLEMIRTKSRILKRTPARREMPRGIVDKCVHSFGSWNNAVVAAGLKINRSHSNRMYRRVRTKALDGHICDSISEAIIDDWLVRNKIPHTRDVIYPETQHRADWGIQKNIFIEYFGLAKDSPRYDRAVQKKKMLCRKHKIQLIALYAKDLYPKLVLDNKLQELLVDSGP